MPLVCADCGRQAVMRSAQCAFCGGRLVATAPRPTPGAAAEATTQSDAPKGVPPVQAPRGATGQRASPPGFTSTPLGAGSQPAPPNMPFPNAPPSTSVPFPTASRPPLAPVRPAGPSPDEVYPDPPLWQQILNIPFATTGRRVFFGVAAFIAFGIWGINRVISDHQPKNNPGGIAIYPGGLPSPPQVPPQFAEPQAQPGGPKDRAEAALRSIGVGLVAYADQYGSLPDQLTDGLHELKGFGDFSQDLAQLQDGKLTSYTRAPTADFKYDVATLEAKARNTGEVVRHEVRLRRER